MWNPKGWLFAVCPTLRTEAVLIWETAAKVDGGNDENSSVQVPALTTAMKTRRVVKTFVWCAAVPS